MMVVVNEVMGESDKGLEGVATCEVRLVRCSGGPRPCTRADSRKRAFLHRGRFPFAANHLSSQLRRSIHRVIP